MTQEELIVKFLNNECTSEEAKRASEILHENPDLLQQYLGADDWNEIPENKKIPAHLECAMDTYIEAHLQRRGRYKMLLMAAVFISVVAAGGLFFLFQNNNAYKTAAVDKETLRITNTGNKDSSFLLGDGSEITLSAGAAVKYTKGFDDSARNIFASGKVLFKIAKDSVRPFTVYCNNIATTALGTKFYVDDRNVTDIKIRLLEGKVVVSYVAKTARFKKVYLTEGQECVIDKAAETAIVKNMVMPVEKERKTVISVVKRPAPSKPEEVVAEDAAPLMFQQSALKDVFARLERRFHIKVTYEKGLLDSLYFTGDFKDTGSIEKIIRIITRSNGLTVREENGRYHIEKK